MADHDRISALCARLRDLPQVHAASVEYPPATADQIQCTEEQLGCILPQCLRAVYMEVANGGRGIGPGMVFYGAEGGCPDDWRRRRPFDLLISHSGWRLHERIVDGLRRHPGRMVVSDDLPDLFIELADWGCGTNVHVDGHTGGVFLIGYGGDIWLDDNQITPLYSIELLAPSLEDYFERWLDNPTCYSDHSLCRLTPDMIDLTGITDENEVWRGLYRFGPNWDDEPDDTAEDEFEMSV